MNQIPFYCLCMDSFALIVFLVYMLFELRKAEAERKQTEIETQRIRISMSEGE